jgi:hypothetical protein
VPRNAGAFAQYVSRNLRPPVLAYSQRVEFLREARRLGVGRFEAHLIIAAAVHRLGVGAEGDAPSRGPSWLAGWAMPLVACAVVQSIILVAAWSAIR